MAKLTVEQKRARVKELEEVIANAEKEIHELFETQKPTIVANHLPEGFSLNERMLEIIKAVPEGVHKDVIREDLKNSFGVSVTDAQIQSALAYLKNTKKMLDIVGRGVYKSKK